MIKPGNREARKGGNTMIEITESSLYSGVIEIHAVEVGEEGLMNIERCRIREDQRWEMIWVFDTTKKSDYYAIRRYLKAQAVTRSAHTWGEAVQSIEGHILSQQPPAKFRIYSQYDY